MVRFSVGDVTITRIEEMNGPGMKPAELFRGFSEKMLDACPDALTPGLYHAKSARLFSSIHSWLIEIGGKKVLVDTASGNDKVRPGLFSRFDHLNLPWLDNLKAAGFEPEDIDIVFCTHLHVDHVGWNTKLEDGKWVPTFPQAEYVLGRAEYDHWTTGPGAANLPDNKAVIEDSVTPLIGVADVRMLEDGEEVLPGLVATIAPGHTMQQMVLDHDGPEGGFVCSADVFHHPLQVWYPEMSSLFAENPALAARTRFELFSEWASKGRLVLPSHPGAPFAGYIRQQGGKFRYEPATPV
ncbi:MAG: MBL fold metallo-hydrolase [Flavobacteriaceae bacterium]